MRQRQDTRGPTDGTAGYWKNTERVLLDSTGLDSTELDSTELVNLRLRKCVGTTVAEPPTKRPGKEERIKGETSCLYDVRLFDFLTLALL